MDRLENQFDHAEKHKASIFNRSFTMHGSAKKELPSRHPSTAMERSGSIKKLYNSSFGSMFSGSNSFKGKVKKLCSIFESPKPAQEHPDANSLPPPSPVKPTTKQLLPITDSFYRLPGTEDRVVIYFTSLRGIRRTFEDCYAVRMILKGFRVKIDERDISMDAAYKKELQNVLGEKNVVLPQVFVKGKYIGGAEVIKQLNETGELPRMLKGLPYQAPGQVCGACGDVRFMPCTNCDGSRKVFDEDEGQLKKCPECNENGLVRCPACCS